MHPEFISMFGPRGAEQLAFIVTNIITATTCKGGLYCVGKWSLVIELLLPGWLAGMMLPARRAPGFVRGLAENVLLWRYAGACFAAWVAFGLLLNVNPFYALSWSRCCWRAAGVAGKTPSPGGRYPAGYYGPQRAVARSGGGEPDVERARRPDGLSVWRSVGRYPTGFSLIASGVVVVVAILLWRWRNLLAMTISPDLAFVDGVKLQRAAADAGDGIDYRRGNEIRRRADHHFAVDNPGRYRPPLCPRRNRWPR